MIMGKIILRGSVENSNNQPYPANGLIVIILTFVFRSCYYSLMKLIWLFVSHYSIGLMLLKKNFFFIKSLFNIVIIIIFNTINIKIAIEKKLCRVINCF